MQPENRKALVMPEKCGVKDWLHAGERGALKDGGARMQVAFVGNQSRVGEKVMDRKRRKKEGN